MTAKGGSGGEEKIIDKLIPEQSFYTADKEIVSNALLQIPVALGMMVLFLVFRKRAPWLYYPNVRNTPSHPAHAAGTGLLSWIKPVITVSDTKLLGLLGLDGFMFLQTIKLLFRICMLLSLTLVPSLCYVFYVSTTGKDGTFARLSVHSVRNHHIFTALVIAVYLVTFMVFYLIFIYYKRYVMLRQLYLSSPATMTSIVKLKKLSRNVPTGSTAIDVIDVKTRTVVMSRLPSALRSDAACLDYIRNLGIGEVEEAILVRDTAKLQRLYERRDVTVQDIEKSIDTAFRAMAEHYVKAAPLVRASFGSEASGLVAAACAAGCADSPLDLREKIDLANVFFERADDFVKKTGQKSYLRLYLAKFKELDGAIDSEIRRLENEYCDDAGARDGGGKGNGEKSGEEEDSKEEKEDGGDNAAPQSDGQAHSKTFPDTVLPVDHSLFIRADLQKDVSFFSLHQLCHPKRYRRLFTLDLPIGKKKAFVTFKDQKTTGIVMQSRIGSRVFSVSAEAAPAPHDVIWKNMTKNEAFCYMAKVLSSIFFVAMYILFYYLVTSIITILVIDVNSENYFMKLLQRHSTLASIYSGFLVPLVYNIILFFVPIVIAALLNMQGIMAYSTFQVELMNTFSLFLFFNGFLSAFCGKVLLVAIPRIYHQQETVRQAISKLGASIIKSSIFFFNAIVQRLCIGTAMVFLKPAPFLFNFVISPLVRKNRRQQMEIEFAPPIDLGNAIPNILLIFPMVIAYSCISPVIVLLGAAFYAVNYFAYKNELIYAARVEFESGGIFWKYSAKFVLYSICIFHAATAAKIYVAGYGGIAVGLAPLGVFSYLYFSGLKQMFERSCEYFPINAVEEEYLDDFGSRAVAARADLLARWVEHTEAADEDTLPVAELHGGGSSEEPPALYRDPATATALSTIILPRHFYAVSRYIRDHDRDNVFRLH